MDSQMLHMAGRALLILAEPSRIGFLVVGVLLGLIIGVIPGLGGLLGLSLLLPFTYSMDPFAAFALMMGLAAVTTTSDTIPAVLFGVPGTVGSAATVLDGHPLARQGQAARALGAAFFASVVGGLFGAILLGLSVPVLRPIMFSIGTPDLLAMCLLGLSMVATLSGGAAMKGLSAVCLGLLVATVGEEAQTGVDRWTFGSSYLLDGVPIVPIALGLFALPELAELAVGRSRIAKDETYARQSTQMEGVRDVVRNWFLVLRCSAIGSILGAVPGIGAAVIDWIAYGHALSTEKGAKETFGKGDIRGVIASESSNNAKEGGALVPTIAFGVPGSASMALLLSAFLIHGIVPGPKMLGEKLDVTYTLVWSVAFANIIGAGLCFLFAGQLARIARVRAAILVPIVLSFTFIGAFQGSRGWGDLYILLLFGVVGWIMKLKGWPRPPMVLGIVLGGLVENYMFISTQLYGAGWLKRPIVVILLLLAVIGIARPIIAAMMQRRGRRRTWKLGFNRAALGSDAIFAATIFCVFAAALYVAHGWTFAAQLFPMVISAFGLVFAAAALLSPFVVVPADGSSPAEGERSGHLDIGASFDDLSRAEVARRAAVYFGFCVGYVVLSWIVGLIPALFLFIVAFMRFDFGERWRVALSTAGAVTVVCYLLFHVVLVVPWPSTLVGEWFPALRSIHALALF